MKRVTNMIDELITFKISNGRELKIIRDSELNSYKALIIYEDASALVLKESRALLEVLTAVNAFTRYVKID
jgi:hypothetical protein